MPGGAHRRELAELVELPQGQERGEQECHRQDLDHDLGGAVQVEAGDQVERGAVVEEDVDLLEDVHDHEDDDESRESEQQIAEELAQQVAVEDLHAPDPAAPGAPPPDSALPGAPAGPVVATAAAATTGGPGIARRTRSGADRRSLARSVPYRPQAPRTRFGSHMASHGGTSSRLA